MHRAAARLLATALALGPVSAFAAEDDPEPADEWVEEDDPDPPGPPETEAAEPGPPGEEDAPPARDSDDAFGHRGQLGLRAGLVAGFRMVFRYDDSPYCAVPDPSTPPNEQQKICGFGAPLATNLALSFALLDFLEPFAFARLGLAGERQTDTSPLVLLGVGTRLYTVGDRRLKIFLEPAVAYQLEGRAGDPAFDYGPARDYKKDLVFHLGIGPQYDFSENFGAFLSAGMDLGIFRAIHSTLLLQLGVQARL